MILEERVDRLSSIMAERKIDLMVIGTSGDLNYLAGIDSSLCKRFKGLFIFADKRYFYITAKLYYEETREALGEDADIIVWDDSEGFITAIEKANKKYNLEGLVIGVNEAIRAVDILDIMGVVNSKYVNGSSVMEELRLIKTDEEREYMKKAGEIADDVVGELVKFIKPGMTERDIKDKIYELFEKKWELNRSFEAIVASGPNSSKPHYNGCDRIIEENDVIVLDLGCRYKGYCSDISRMVFVGEPTEEQKKVYEIVLKAQSEAEKFARRGVTAEEVDAVARNIIKDAGYGECFINRLGHGIGMDVHEGPYIKEGNKQVLENGMAFSIEPGICIPGKFGMRVENIVFINNDKAETLNNFTKEMIVIK